MRSSHSLAPTRLDHPLFLITSPEHSPRPSRNHCFCWVASPSPSFPLARMMHIALTCLARQRSLARQKAGSGCLRTAQTWRRSLGCAFPRGDDEDFNLRTPRDGPGGWVPYLNVRVPADGPAGLLQGGVVWYGGADGITHEVGREPRHAADTARAAGCGWSLQEPGHGATT